MDKIINRFITTIVLASFFVVWVLPVQAQIIPPIVRESLQNLCQAFQVHSRPFLDNGLVNRQYDVGAAAEAAREFRYLWNTYVPGTVAGLKAAMDAAGTGLGSLLPGAGAGGTAGTTMAPALAGALIAVIIAEIAFLVWEVFEISKYSEMAPIQEQKGSHMQKISEWIKELSKKIKDLEQAQGDQQSSTGAGIAVSAEAGAVNSLCTILTNLSEISQNLQAGQMPQIGQVGNLVHEALESENLELLKQIQALLRLLAEKIQAMHRAEQEQFFSYGKVDPKKETATVSKDVLMFLSKEFQIEASTKVVLKLSSQEFLKLNPNQLYSLSSQTSPLPFYFAAIDGKVFVAPAVKGIIEVYTFSFWGLIKKPFKIENFVASLDVKKVKNKDIFIKILPSEEKKINKEVIIPVSPEQLNQETEDFSKLLDYIDPLRFFSHWYMESEQKVIVRAGRLSTAVEILNNLGLSARSSSVKTEKASIAVTAKDSYDRDVAQGKASFRLAPGQDSEVNFVSKDISFLNKPAFQLYTLEAAIEGKDASFVTLKEKNTEQVFLNPLLYLVTPNKKEETKEENYFSPSVKDLSPSEF